MAAQQGEKYRVLSPKEVWAQANPGKEYRANKVYGQGEAPDYYRHSTTDEEGNTAEVIDYFGDVLNASENVPYPRGSNDDYRNVGYIDEKEYFERVEQHRQTSDAGFAS